MQQNFLQKQTWKKIATATWRGCKRAWPYTWPPLAVIVVILAILGVWYGPAAKTIATEALAAKADLEKAQDYIVQQDFTEGQLALTSGKQHLQTAQNRLGRLRSLKKLPYVKTQVIAVEELLAAGIASTSGIERLSTWAETVVRPFKTGKSFSLSSLKPEQKRVILKAIAEAQPDLQAAKASIDLAMTHVNAIPESGLVGKLREAVEPFRKQLPGLQDGITQAIPASRILPPLLGYPEEQTYLFLLQNNAELRPAGGFIGTYGILKVKDGEIVSFTTDNVYNLDDRAKNLQITPPAPLTRYNKVNRWLFRDSNWSPDFPTAAQEALTFYRREGGNERRIHGVIAVDPTFFQDLLQITGSITISKRTFTSENFAEELQYITSVEFAQQGVDASLRKGIIGDLGAALIEKMLKLPKEKYGKAWTIFQKNLEQKHVMVWVGDTARQDQLTALGWTGHVETPRGDTLMVVDANMASLKSDPAVKRTISYTVRRQDNDLIANVTVKYENTGTLNWKTTRYRTYTRVYVPRGSTLLESAGAMVDCKVSRAGKVETLEELGLTAFAGFTCTEIGESHELRLRYKLPNTISALLESGEYALLVQKQPGTPDHQLNIELQLGKALVDADDAPDQLTEKKQVYSASTNLLIDRSFQLRAP